MYAQAIALAVTAALSAGGAWQYQSARYERLLAEQRTEYATAQVRALEIAHADTIRLQAQASKAAAAAATRLQRLSADRDRLRTAADGLRDDLATATSRLPHAPPDAVIEYATATTDVFGQCAAALERLAATAQGHADDVQTLTEAWPIQSPR